MRIVCSRLMLALAFTCTGHACAGAALAAADAKTEMHPIARQRPPIEELKNIRIPGLTSVGTGDARERSLDRRAVSSGCRVSADRRAGGRLPRRRRPRWRRPGEAVVVLTYRSGGTATLSFLAVVTRRDGTLRNVATTALGDRVQVRSARIDGGRLLVSAVRAGAERRGVLPRRARRMAMEARRRPVERTRHREDGPPVARRGCRDRVGPARLGYHRAGRIGAGRDARV